MLTRLKPLLGHGIRATDQNLGNANDFYFDDQEWIIRYLVVDTGNWLPGRLVLIATEALGQQEWSAQEVSVNLTAKEIQNSPSIEIDQPVSRQKEQALRAHFQWPAYWDLSGAPMARTVKPMLPDDAQDALDQSEDFGDPHLQNVNEVLNYSIQAVDGKIGHVEDFMIDHQSWHIRYMVVDTGNWLPDKKVLVAPGWIKEISWTDQTASVVHSRGQIQSCPEFEPDISISRDYERQIYQHYGHANYWV